jgi:uncharacterized protein
MVHDRNGLQVLDRAECLHLLAGQAFGRVAITSGALPAILPVNYRLVDERVVFSTGPGAKLVAATDHAVIAFEVDDFDAITHTGWSVLVTGVAVRVADRAVEARPWAAGVPRWLARDGARLVTLGTERISGRRLAHDRVDGHGGQGIVACTTIGP